MNKSIPENYEMPSIHLRFAASSYNLYLEFNRKLVEETNPKSKRADVLRDRIDQMVLRGMIQLLRDKTLFPNLPEGFSKYLGLMIKQKVGQRLGCGVELEYMIMAPDLDYPCRVVRIRMSRLRTIFSEMLMALNSHNFPPEIGEAVSKLLVVAFSYAVREA